MDYLKVLDHLKAFSVDRIITSDFSDEWETNGTVTVALSTDHTTVHDNSLLVTNIAKDAYVYVCREADEGVERKAFRLDDRENMQLHIYSDVVIAEATLELILSDSKNLTTPTLTLDVPAIPKDTVNIINIEIPEADRKSLSNIMTVGVKALSTVTGNFYIALCNATSTKYIVTVEDLEMKIGEGVDYVMSKLGASYTTLPDDRELEDAVHLAAAGYAWMKQKENEQYQFDYGNQTTTQNYGVSLLRRAKMIVNSYIAGGDAESGASTESSTSYINTSLVGGHSLNHRHNRRFR